MANMILGWVNEADKAVLSGGRWAASLPQAALADDRLSNVARALGNQPADAAIVADLGSARPVGLAALFGGALAPGVGGTAAGSPGPAARYRIRAGDDAAMLGPVLDLDFTGYGAPDPRLEFDRPSLAAWIDRDGLMQGCGLTEPLALTLDGFAPPATLAITLQRRDRRFFVGEAVRLTDPEAPADRWLAGSVAAFDAATGAVNLAIATVAGSGSSVIAWRLESCAPRCNRAQDHHPVSGDRLGFRIEEARTNLLLRSADPAAAAWTRQGVALAGDTAVAPDGTASAMLREDGSAGFHQLTQGIAVTEGAAVAVSLYARPAARSRFAIVVSNGGDYAQGTFDLAALTAGTAQGGTGMATAARIEPAGNGWLRCTLVASLAGRDAYLVAFRLLNPGGSYAGDGAGGLFFWGAQAEEGGFATSYIPTTGVSYARAAETPRLALACLPAGTLLADYASAKGAHIAIASLNDGGADNQVSLIQGGGSARIAYVASGGVNNVGLSTGPAMAGAFQRSAFGFQADDFAVATAGAAAISGGSGAVPATAGLDIGHRAGANPLNGHVRQLSLYPRRLSDVELAAASAGPEVQLGPVLYDSGWQDVWAGQQPRAGYCAVLLAAPDVSARYWRIDIDDSDSTDGFLDFARLWLGPAVTLSTNYEYGASLGMEADVAIARAQGGALRFEDRSRQRVATYPVEHQTAQEAYRVHLELQRVAGLSGEVLAVPDPEDASYRAERVFIARLRSLRPIANRYFQRFGTELELEERLT